MAKKTNLFIDQGASFSYTFNITDSNGDNLDTTGYSANAVLRKQYSSSNSVGFGINISNNGVLTLSLTANQTSNLQFLQYVYDVELTTNTGNVQRFAEGIVVVSPQVTR